MEKFLSGCLYCVVYSSCDVWQKCPIFPGSVWTPPGLSKASLDQMSISQPTPSRLSRMSSWSRDSLQQPKSSASVPEDMSSIKHQMSDTDMRDRNLVRNIWTGVSCITPAEAFKSGLVAHTDYALSAQRHSRVCPICGKGFDRREYYEDHMNMHNNVKAHKCSNCSSTFTYKRNLWQHVRDGVCTKNKNVLWNLGLFHNLGWRWALQPLIKLTEV